MPIKFERILNIPKAMNINAKICNINKLKKKEKINKIKPKISINKNVISIDLAS